MGFFGGGGSGAVDSVFSRTGAVTAQPNDYNVSQLAGLPVAVNQGGTGATTASGARTNLGAAAATHTHTASDVTDFASAVASALQAASAVGIGVAPTLSALDVQSTSGAQQAWRYSASAYAKSTVDNFGILSIHGTAGYYYWRNAGDTANMLELYTNSGDTYLRHNLSGHNLYMSSLGTILFQAGGSYVLNLASDHILHRYGTLLKFESVTASATQSQGQGPLSGANFVRITTCATANDAITLSGSTIWSSVNSTRPLFIYNDGAETCQVFPPSGFDLGQGTNNSDTIAAGALAIFVSTSANTLVRFL